MFNQEMLMQARGRQNPLDAKGSDPAATEKKQQNVTEQMKQFDILVQDFIMRNTKKDIKEDYLIGEVIGDGAYGDVRLCVHKLEYVHACVLTSVRVRKRVYVNTIM